MIKLACYSCLAFASLTAVLAPIQAGCADWDQFPRASDQELDQQRGGFLVADGISFDFGAVMRTSVNGELVMETTLNWTPSGAVTQQTVHDSALAAAGPDIQTVLTSSNLAQLNGGNGLTLSQGQTQLIQQIGANGLQNIILNTASNQTLRQDLEITVTIARAADFQNSITLSQLGLALDRASATASIGALR